MILALDIAFSNLGWSVINKGEIIDYGTIRTEKDKRKSVKVSDDKAVRAAFIAQELDAIIKRHGVQGIVGELPSGSQNAAASNLLGWAAGIVVGVAACNNLPCEWISEGDSKKAAIGRRTATKDEMMAWAAAAFPRTNFPKQKCHFEHVADSLAAYHGLKTGVLARAFG
jgi:Holliday junction resolvasome RuvABC endonuclease subunit